MVIVDDRMDMSSSSSLSSAMIFPRFCRTKRPLLGGLLNAALLLLSSSFCRKREEEEKEEEDGKEHRTIDDRIIISPTPS